MCEGAAVPSLNDVTYCRAVVCVVSSRYREKSVQKKRDKSLRLAYEGVNTTYTTF